MASNKSDWTPKRRALHLIGIRTKRRDYHGKNNPKWKGGKVCLADVRTAIYMPNHPDAVLFKGNYILEYRLIAERKLGRRLLKTEIVHHKNGDVTDNRMENLEVMTQAEHARIHSLDRRDKKTGRFLPLTRGEKG